ncbi:MAG: transketolase C-terminal domain-containing protein [Candidatus Thorarchaeota archaeon]|nr:MAG: pyruvate ferredoxin oxidoreductase [Candidatus Thorarchaeota archaeon]RLI58464.1 MAG: pyruvate ferredoxin oxidoreductase [Candidatus Thorarchaeota archaeon]
MTAVEKIPADKIKIEGLTGDAAIAHALKQCDVDVLAAYPITPQTIIVEDFQKFVANGEVKTKVIPVESEHSAMSACVGAAAAGGRVATATASAGLALMWEILYCAASMRMPIVLAVANRALSAPINIHNDWSDTYGARDSGFIQIYCQSCQEAYDTTIMAFKLAEDHRVLLPVMVCIDGFILSHNVERVEMLPDEAVREFLGVREPVLPLDPDNPITMGPLALTDYYFEIKEGQDRAMYNVPEVFKEVEEAFKKMTGRAYGMYETYRTEDAEIIIITHSTPGGTAKVVADVLREQGEKVGVVRLRMFRPFPVDEIVKEVKHAKAVAVFEKCRSFGATCNPLAMEIRAALYDLDEKPMVTDFVIGLGGRDVPPTTIVEGYNKTKEYLAKGKAPLYETLGVRK